MYGDGHSVSFIFQFWTTTSGRGGEKNTTQKWEAENQADWLESLFVFQTFSLLLGPIAEERNVGTEFFTFVSEESKKNTPQMWCGGSAGFLFVNTHNPVTTIFHMIFSLRNYAKVRCVLYSWSTVMFHLPLLPFSRFVNKHNYVGLRFCNTTEIIIIAAPVWALNGKFYDSNLVV